MTDIENKKTYEETQESKTENEENGKSKQKDIQEGIQKVEENITKLEKIKKEEELEKKKDGDPDEILSKALESTESNTNRKKGEQDSTNPGLDGFKDSTNPGVSIDEIAKVGLTQAILNKHMREAINENIKNYTNKMVSERVNTNIGFNDSVDRKSIKSNSEYGSTEYFEKVYDSALSELSETFPEIQGNLENKKIGIKLVPDEEYKDTIYIGINKDGINTVRSNAKRNYKSRSSIRRNETGCFYENPVGIMTCIDDIKSKHDKCEITIE